jgi:hypothetical protein
VKGPAPSRPVGTERRKARSRRSAVTRERGASRIPDRPTWHVPIRPARRPAKGRTPPRRPQRSPPEGRGGDASGCSPPVPESRHISGNVSGLPNRPHQASGLDHTTVDRSVRARAICQWMAGWAGAPAGRGAGSLLLRDGRLGYAAGFCRGKTCTYSTPRSSTNTPAT